MQTEAKMPRGPERRGKDRRQTQAPSLPFPDRRQGERRSGADRRTTPGG